MPLIDDAVITAAEGYVYIADLGTLRPTPSDIDDFNPDTFGCKSVRFKVNGTPTSYTIDVDGVETSALPLASTPAVVIAALEALTGVGLGDVLVTGVNAGDTNGLVLTFVGRLQGTDVVVTEGSFVGGTAPAAVVTQLVAVNGWVNTGHTSRDDMPEFGFDGGDTEVKGTWQKKRLREIATGDPVADYVTINFSQFNAEALELYYGSNSSVESGVFGVSGEFVPLEKALLVVLMDGSTRIAFYAPKASIKRDDAINLPVDDIASLPVKATFLNLGTQDLYQWISEDLLA